MNTSGTKVVFGSPTRKESRRLGFSSTVFIGGNFACEDAASFVDLIAEADEVEVREYTGFYALLLSYISADDPKVKFKNDFLRYQFEDAADLMRAVCTIYRKQGRPTPHPFARAEQGDSLDEVLEKGLVRVTDATPQKQKPFYFEDKPWSE